MVQKYFTEEERKAAHRESNARYRKRNKEAILERGRKYREENLDKVRESTRLCQRKRYNDPLKFPILMLQSIKSRKRENGKVVKLTLDDIEELIINSNGVCAVSGLPLTCERRNPLLASIDRIDSNKGYVKGNVQLVATCVNLAKHTLPQEQFVAMCKAVVDFNS